MVELSLKTKGILSLIGGFSLMLMTGSIFMWGALNVYVTSYFRQKHEPDLSLSTGGAIFPVMTAALATGIPFGIKGIKLFGQARYSLLVSTIIASLMVILSSYAEYFYQFAIIYGVINGLAGGTIYFVPIYMGYLYFPNNRGMVSGINTCGFALCSFAFGLVFTHFVNPDSLQQNSNSDGYSYYDGNSISVAQNVPEALRKIGYCFLAISVCATQLIFYHPNQIGEEEKRLKKELQKKEEEKQHMVDNLIKIDTDLQNIQEKQEIQNQKQQQELKQEQQNKTNEQQKENHGFKDQKKIKEGENILRMSQQFVVKQLHIVEIEEEALKKQISIQHSKDEQTGFAYINPLVYDQIQQQQSNTNQVRNRQESVQSYNKVIELVNHESKHNSNRAPHINSYVVESEKEAEKLEENLSQKEQEAKEQLEEANKKQEEIDRLDKLGAPSISAALRQPQLYMSVFLCILCLGFGSLMNSNYKTIAKSFGYTTDSFQTLVGSLGGIANGFSRPFWATLLDKFAFTRIITIVICIQIILSISMQATNDSEGFYALWVFLAHWCLGGVLGMLPVFSAQLNGVKVGAQLFGFYWYGFSIANFIQFILVLELKKTIGFDNIFYIYFAQLVLAFFIANLYKFKVEWSKHYITTDVTKKSETSQPQSNQVLCTNNLDTEHNPIISCEKHN